jgi:hypothetical protein
MFKDVKYNPNKGFDDWSHEQRGTPIPSIEAKLTATTATDTTGKLHRGSTIPHLRYLICREESENNMGRMMGCSHQKFRVWW